MNPAIVSENRPDLLRPDLNPFNPANGFNPTGDSNYSEEFQAKYFKAQAERMNRLIDEALDIRSRIEEGKYIYTDDAPFEIPRIDGAHLLELDVDIRHSTLNPHKLIKNDGTVVTQIVETVHVPSPQTAETSKTFWSGARGPMTVASFLSANATRATDSMNGIDWFPVTTLPYVLHQRSVFLYWSRFLPALSTIFFRTVSSFTRFLEVPTKL